MMPASRTRYVRGHKVTDYARPSGSDLAAQAVATARLFESAIQLGTWTIENVHDYLAGCHPKEVGPLRDALNALRITC